MATTTGTIVFYDQFIERLGDGTLDMDGDTLKCALFTNTYVPNAATDVTFSVIDTNEIANGDGYTTGGDTLTTVDWSQSGGALTFNTDDPEWTASGSGITARRFVVYSSTPATNNLILYGLLNDADADVVTTATNTLTIQVNASGWFTGAMTDA